MYGLCSNESGRQMASKRASAIGAPPYYGVDGTNRYVESSNLTPSFPSTECLHHGTFKVVVGSWRRLNEAKSGTNDFAVNVSAYAPKTTPVTRVTLVDVDIPPTQLLIEEPWCRMYFDNGIYMTTDCRSLDVTYAVSASYDTVVRPPAACLTTAVVLPLSIDAVTAYTLLPGTDSIVRLYFAHRVPFPIASIVEAWCGLAARGCGTMCLVGVPTLPDFTLSSACVIDDTTMSFDVQSAKLYDALQHYPDAAKHMYMYASPVPGPAYLATILSRCMTEALAATTYALPPSEASVVYGACEQLDCPTTAWRFDLQYTPIHDRYALTLTTPEFVRGVTLSGSAAAYMGFGSPTLVEVQGRHVVAVPAQNQRYQSPLSYASLPIGSPRCGTTFAASIQAAFNACCWDGFSFDVVIPGLARLHVGVPSGNMTLKTLADVVKAAIVQAALPSVGPYASITVTYGTSGTTFSGLVFASPVLAFGLDFAADPTFAPIRIGYDARCYPAALAHYPTRKASHCPELATGLGVACACTLPRGKMQVVYRPDVQELVLQVTPFPAFAATLVTTPGPDASPGFRSTGTTQALQVGACVIVAGTASDGVTYQQRRAYVVVVATVGAVTTYYIAFSDTDPALPGFNTANVTIVPQDAPPLNLYLQRTFQNGVPAEVMGFQARTYSACGELVSPGTVDVREDPYILLCLGFESPTATPLTGDVYYPFLNPSANQLVFAKVARAAGCIYRTDFDKVFDHTFNGAGTTLGYIRVQVLNSDGTPYQTHGHPVSITLKFDSRESGIAFGDGTVSMGLGDNMGDSQLVLGNGRGMILPPGAVRR